MVQFFFKNNISEFDSYSYNSFNKYLLRQKYGILSLLGKFVDMEKIIRSEWIQEQIGGQTNRQYNNGFPI